VLPGCTFDPRENWPTTTDRPFVGGLW